MTVQTLWMLMGVAWGPGGPGGWHEHVVVPWEASAGWVGRPVVIYGTLVRQVPGPRSHRYGFHEDWWEYLVVVLEGAAADVHRDLAGHRVAVAGRVERDGPRLVLRVSNPSCLHRGPPDPLGLHDFAVMAFPGARSPRRAAASRSGWRCMWIDLGGLFDAIDDPHTADEQAATLDSRQCRELAEWLTAYAPDVVLLNGIENGGTVEQFVWTWLPDEYTTIATADQHPGRRTQCALISRHPCAGVTTWLPTRGHPAVLSAVLAPPGLGPVTLSTIDIDPESPWGGASPRLMAERIEWLQSTWWPRSRRASAALVIGHLPPGGVADAVGVDHDLAWMAWSDGVQSHTRWIPGPWPMGRGGIVVDVTPRPDPGPTRLP